MLKEEQEKGIKILNFFHLFGLERFPRLTIRMLLPRFFFAAFPKGNKLRFPFSGISPIFFVSVRRGNEWAGFHPQNNIHSTKRRFSSPKVKEVEKFISRMRKRRKASFGQEKKFSFRIGKSRKPFFFARRFNHVYDNEKLCYRNFTIFGRISSHSQIIGHQSSKKQTRLVIISTPSDRKYLISVAGKNTEKIGPKLISKQLFSTKCDPGLWALMHRISSEWEIFHHKVEVYSNEERMWTFRTLPGECKYHHTLAEKDENENGKMWSRKRQHRKKRRKNIFN